MEEIEIIDASLLIEKKSGFTTIFSIIEYPPAVKDCNILFPDEDDYKKALDISWKLREVGKPVGAIDILIASMCINRTIKIVTKDRDFESIKFVEPKFKLEIKK